MAKSFKVIFLSFLVLFFVGCNNQKINKTEIKTQDEIVQLKELNTQLKQQLDNRSLISKQNLIKNRNIKSTINSRGN